MPSFRNYGTRGGILSLSMPGDVTLSSWTIGESGTIGAGTNIPASALVTGNVLFTDSDDDAFLPSSVDVYNALVGEGSDPELIAGMGFYCRFYNPGGDAVVLKSSADNSMSISNTTIAAGAFAEIFFRFDVVQRPVSFVVAATVASDEFPLVFSNPTATGAPVGPSPFAVNLSVGARITEPSGGFFTSLLLTEVISGPGGVRSITLNDISNLTGNVGVTATSVITGIPLFTATSLIII